MIITTTVKTFDNSFMNFLNLLFLKELKPHFFYLSLLKFLYIFQI